VEKGRIPAAARERLLAAIDDPGTPCRLVALDRQVVDAVALVNRSDIPEMPDRIIAATALLLGLPLISRDAEIRSSEIRTIW